MNYYEHHIGDYAEATSHLSLLEDAVYSRLIRKYYATERALPADLKTVQRLVGARSPDELAAVEVILNEFFVLQPDGWHNERCDEEIVKTQTRIEAARSNGKRGGRPVANPTLTQPEPTGLIPLTQPKALQSPYSIHQTPDDATRLASPPPGFQQTPEGEMAIALRDLGVAVASSDRILIGWVSAGFTTAQAVEAVGIARIRKPWPERIPANYLDPILRQPRKPPKSSADRITWRPDSDETGPCTIQTSKASTN